MSLPDSICTFEISCSTSFTFPCRLGELLVVRQGVNLQGVGDIPELYWDEPVLESESCRGSRISLCRG